MNRGLCLGTVMTLRMIKQGLQAESVWPLGEYVLPVLQWPLGLPGLKRKRSGPEEEEVRERVGKPASSSSPTPSLLGVFGEHGQQRPEG